jgi:pullulanase
LHLFKGLSLSLFFPAVTKVRNMRRSQYLIFIALLYLFRIIPAPVSAASPAGQNTVRVHYHRTNGDYAGWSIYTFTGALHPTTSFSNPDPPTGTDDFGVYFDVPLLPNATELQFIIVDANGLTKNCQNNLTQTVSAGLEVWILQDDCTLYQTRPRTDLVGNIKQARAYWVNRDTLAWFGADPDDTYQLYYSADAGITDVATGGVEGDGHAVQLAVDPNGLPQTIIDKFPFLKGATSFKIPSSQLAQVPALLKDQLVLVNLNGSKPVVPLTYRFTSFIYATFQYRIKVFRKKIEENTPRSRSFSPAGCGISAAWLKRD